MRAGWHFKVGRSISCIGFGLMHFRSPWNTGNFQFGPWYVDWYKVGG